MTDEQKQKMSEEYADFDCHEYGDEREIAIDCYLAGLNRGLDECQKLREALELLKQDADNYLELVGTTDNPYSLGRIDTWTWVREKTLEALQHTSKKEGT